MGVSWLSHPTLLTLDVSFFGPQGGPDDPLPLVELPPGVDLPAAFVPEVAYHESSARLAVGFELVAMELLPLQGGLFMETSEAPSLEPSSEVYRSDDVDTFGASLSVGVRAGGYDFAIGAMAMLGRGESLGLSREPGTPPYRARDLSEETIMVFIAGGNHAVKRLAQSITD
jgi:hypothetical protein